MSHSLHAVAAKIRRSLTIASATLLIVLALVVGVGRELVKEVERFHGPLEAWLSTRTQLAVRFTRISGEWNQASPELHLYGVSLSNPAKPDARPAHIAQVSIRLSLSNTLLNLSPRLRLRVHGAELNLDRIDGQFTWLGKSLSPASGDSPGGLSALLRDQPRISIYDSRLGVDGIYGRRGLVSLSFLKLFWEDNHAYLDGEAMLRGPDEMKVVIKSELAVPADTKQIQGTSFVEFSQGQLARWLPDDVASRLPVALQGGGGKTQLWLHWFNDAPLTATLKFDWRDVSIAPRDQAPVSLERMAGVARWQGQWQKFWQFGLRDLVIESGGRRWRPATLLVNARREAEDNWTYQVSTADVSVATGVTPVLSLIPQGTAFAEALTTMQPAGRLQDVFVVLNRHADKWSLLRAHGALRDYSQKPWQKVPGLQNAGLGFLWESDTLWLDFNETGVTLDYPAMFRTPLMLTMMQGSVAIKVAEDSLQVRSSPLAVFTPHGTSHTRISLRLPRNGADVVPEMALQVTLRDIGAEYASLYLPAGIIPEKLLTWLDGSLKGGTLKRGDILFNGPLHKPDIENARSVMLGFQVDNGQLQFLPDWQEPVRGLKGDVIVDNGLVEAHADGGEYYGLKLAHSRIWTARSGAEAHLHVETTGEGEASAGLRLLRESPLGKTLKTPLSDMTLEGPLGVAFSLDAPLTANAKLAGKADVTLREGAFKWPSMRLDAAKVNVALSYDFQKGLNTQRFDAEFFGGRTSGRLYQQPVRGGRALMLDLAGKAPVSSVRDWLQMPALDLATGVIPYQLRMTVPPAAAKKPGLLSIKSSLQGVAANLPEPFSKTASRARPLEVSLSLGESTRLNQIRYDDAISVKWETRNGRWQRGGIHLGSGEPGFARNKPWRMTGVLPRFRAEEWEALVTRLTPKGDNAAAPRFSLLSQFDDSSVTVQHLYLGDEDYGKVPLRLATDVHYVTVTAAGERIQGRLTLPHTYLDAPTQRSAETPVSLYLQKLVLPAAKEDEASAPDPALDMLPPPPTLHPRLLPAAHVRIDQLLAGEDDRGRYSMTIKPVTEGVSIEALQMTLKKMRFTGNGRWLAEANGAARTYFSGRASTDNVADVLTAWNYAASIDSESAAVDMDVDWAGAPYQFKVARTQGNLRAQLNDGHFLKVSNNAVGRVWGLLNFETWMSRMQLRFRDVSDNAMPFDEIRGRFKLANNRIDVSKLRVESPSIKMRMDGLVDMSERQLNMQWAVTVPVTRNLMLPAAVVGGLPGAATAYVIDKVLSSQLDKLTTLTYDVTGTFDQPQTRLRVPLK